MVSVVEELDNEQKTDARKRELEDASLVGMSPREHAAFLASESGKAGKSGKEGKVSMMFKAFEESGRS